MKLSPSQLLRRGLLPDMVHWYKPSLLAQVGIRTMISSTFGQYADQRLLQAVTDSANEEGLRARHDFSDPANSDPNHRLSTDSHGGVWIATLHQGVVQAAASAELPELEKYFLQVVLLDFPFGLETACELLGDR